MASRSARKTVKKKDSTSERLDALELEVSRLRAELAEADGGTFALAALLTSLLQGLRIQNRKNISDIAFDEAEKVVTLIAGSINKGAEETGRHCLQNWRIASKAGWAKLQSFYDAASTKKGLH